MASLDNNLSEEEAIRRATAESLVTARQDEERRQSFLKQEVALIEKLKRRSESPILPSAQQASSSLTVRRVTSMPTSGSLPDIQRIGLNNDGSKDNLAPENIVRPRPQARGVRLRSRSPSPVFGKGLPPPRPDPPKKHGETHQTGPPPPPRPANLPTRPISTPATTTTTVPRSTPSSVPDDFPLISLSPPKASSADCSDFDLSIFDPLNSPNNVTSGSTIADKFSQAYNANQTQPKANYQGVTNPATSANGGLPRNNSQSNMGTIFENQSSFDGMQKNGNTYKKIGSNMFAQGATGPAINMPNTSYRPQGTVSQDPYAALRQPSPAPMMRPPQFRQPAPGVMTAAGSTAAGSHPYTPLMVGRRTPTQDMPDMGHCGASGSQMVVNLPPLNNSSKTDVSPSGTDDSTYMSLLQATHTDLGSETGAMMAQGDLIELGGAYETVDDYMSLDMFDPLKAADRMSTGGAAGTEEFKSVVVTPKKSAMTGTAPPDETSDIDLDLLDPFSLSALKKKASVQRQRHDPLPELPAEPSDEEKRNTPKRLSRVETMRGRDETVPVERVTDTDNTEDELKSFCQMVARLKGRYKCTDKKTNIGLVMSPLLNTPPQLNMSVKLTVKTSLASEDIAFTCDLNSMVEHVVSHVLLSEADPHKSVSADDYILQVYGLKEYLDNNCILGKYEYVQTCLKLDREIRFTLLDTHKITRPLLRTKQDDNQPILVPKHRELDDTNLKVTKDQVNIMMEVFYKEVEKLRELALQKESGRVRCEAVVQAVKAIQAKLCQIETVDMDKAIKRLRASSQPPPPHLQASPKSPKHKDDFVFVTNADEDYLVTNTDSPKTSPVRKPSTVIQIDDLYGALEEVTAAVKNMVHMYSRTFHADFQFQSSLTKKPEEKEVTGLMENLIVHVASLHRIPLKWKQVYEDFKVTVALYHGQQQLCKEQTIQGQSRWSESFHDSLLWDEWVQFDILLGTLPREARLIFTLLGVKSVQSGSEQQKVNSCMCWVAMQLFNFKFELVQGSQLLGLWPGDGKDPTGTPLSNTEIPNSVLLQVNMPDFDCDVTFPPVINEEPSQKQDFKSLHPNDQEGIQDLLARDFLSTITKEEREVLWEKRFYLTSLPDALPILLQEVNSWDWGSLMAVYPVINEWAPLPPLKALILLLPRFPDTHIRTKAVEWLHCLSSDELVDYLPHLVQALKFESYHNSALAGFLLERSITSVRVAHHLYWMLKEAADDTRYRKRYQLLFGALMSSVGVAMREEFSKQEDLCKMLGSVAEKVKAAKDKEAVLQRELSIVWDFLQHDTIRIPLNPSMQISGVDIKSCSYFPSFTLPLKLVLRNADSQAEPHYTMFKAGDDLRQDMLTMQLIRIMDKVWLKDGLDLKIITFGCQPTSSKKGLVEIVTEAETLRKIQVRYGHGIAGSFKDSTIAHWLQAQNPTELEYEKAVDNFTASCAGYCVATYVLGICDRHNDNIMVKQSGHMFHIDFGKFLGDAQMFGNIKRDRVPFVLTSDMAYVINGGHKASHRFQQFVDLCCQAFNILRRHSNLLITLFMLMSRSGIPGVTEGAAKYVQKALLPQQTDPEATAIFTRMIEESLKSLSTQINFFFHNLAQMKFSGHNEGALLSFIPKTYSLQTDGKIGMIQLYSFQKRYNPEKYYIYIIKVIRETQKVETFVFRKYSEFCELQSKLVSMFPLAKIPSLGANRPLLGRTHVKAVADLRKAELEKFLVQLFALKAEISESDIVYTFFHPILRDEQDMDKTNLQKLKDNPAPRRQSVSIEGQVKLSITYKHDTLTVMVMHVKDLTTHNGEAPHPYVKLYLLPDKHKVSKRKTKIANATFHPTYNEMLLYRMPLEEVKEKCLQVSVWNYDSLSENEFLGAVHINLRDLDLAKVSDRWHQLQNIHNTSLHH